MVTLERVMSKRGMSTVEMTIALVLAILVLAVSIAIFKQPVANYFRGTTCDAQGYDCRLPQECTTLPKLSFSCDKVGTQEQVCCGVSKGT